MSRDENSSVSLVIVQPTPFCNIDCDYCYLGGRTNKKRMAIDTVIAIKHFLHGVPKHDKRLTIAWHGGEPLSAGRAFYEKAFAVLVKDSFEHGIKHNIQTNAMLIDDEWCSLFAIHEVAIGVSIDGPKHVHDAHRMTRAKHGTFDRVMRGIRTLKKHKIDFTTISVVTPDLLNDIESTIDFFLSLGSKQIAFNVEEMEGSHSESTLYKERTRESLIEFFEKISSAQRQNSWLRIRELDSMRMHFRAPIDSAIHRSTNRAGSIISFDVDGNVSTFSPEMLGLTSPTYGRFIWANVCSDSWQSVLQNPGFKRVRAEIDRGVERCRETCGYFAVCGGGDPSNKLAEHATFDATETNCCRLHVQALADVILEELERARQIPTGPIGQPVAVESNR
ncbi:cyclophane-forming radical SAM/SPASM peptide maturase GrrM/OscB [Mesorhizobium sp. M1405]|uniref:cyclophane-forming radical SAM/SPASM peptide maturase GrrM/OscB n=1 Tax=Mesorhizobium sp. M1405 TaxID=2957098 RepID=UPI003339B029